MSGGHMNYIYRRIEECGKYVDDAEIKDLIIDLAELMHDLEWYLSGDYGQYDYEESLSKFKDKWFGENRNERLREYLTTAIDDMKWQIEKLI